jgi:hypothetical protein
VIDGRVTTFSQPEAGNAGHGNWDSMAISATVSPERRRCEICRRTKFGYDLFSRAVERAALGAHRPSALRTGRS